MTAHASIPWARPHYWGGEREAVEEALTSTWISGGPFVDQFEGRLAAEAGVPYAVAASNGTAALHLAYLATGLGPGDEVIVPGFAFLAAANVALHMGATPVFAEVDDSTWCLDAADVERKVTSRTRFIVPVHTYGNVCEMKALRTAGEARCTPLLEDAAEAFGSTYQAEKAGAMGIMGTLSFHATKTITTGEGGAVLTSDAELRDRMRLFRSHGMARERYWHEVPGHNFRLTNLQAALGCAQLNHLDEIVRERARVWERYRANLSGQHGIGLQKIAAEVVPVMWAVGVRLDPAAYPQGRDVVRRDLARTGIETRPGFHAPTEMEIYQATPLPVCEALSDSVITLPMFPTLQAEEIDFVCDRLLDLGS